MPSPACSPTTITARIVEQVKADDFTHRAGRLTVHLAREFGFCYGVDRAVDYAYQTRERFPDRSVFLTGEIIHNPHVNDKLRAMGIRFLTDAGEGADAAQRRTDVVILPAFGVTVAMLEQFDRARLHDDRHHLRLGAQRVEERAALRRGRLHVDHPRQGLARGDAGDRVAGGAVRRPISGRLRPPETDDRLRLHPLAAAIARRSSQRFGKAASPGFDPDRDLQRIGLANQTTMLMTESLEIGEMFRAAMRDRYGDAALADALSGVRHDLQRHPGSPGRGRRAAARQAGRPDDRRSAATTAATPPTWRASAPASRPTFHIAEPDCLVSAREILHRPVGSKIEVTATRLAARRRAGRRSA